MNSSDYGSRINLKVRFRLRAAHFCSAREKEDAAACHGMSAKISGIIHLRFGALLQ
jgi:hypothetical protein